MVQENNKEVNSDDDIFGEWTKEITFKKPANEKLIIDKKTPLPKKEGKEKKAKKEEEPIAVAFLYAEVIRKDEDFAVMVRDENATLYKWQDNHWKQQTEHDSKQHAFEWLKINFPEKSTHRNAVECYKTALLNAKRLPEKPRENIIPLKDKWLLVTDDGKLVVMIPDKKFGVTYQINANLDSGEELLYTPKEVPENTLFKRFLNTSIPEIEVQNLIQEFTGSTLIQDTRFQKALVNTGEGSNGKSQYLEIVAAMHRKVASMRLDNLEGFGTYNLIDASLAISAEAPKRGLNEEILKACITGDKITVESKFKNAFEYNPTAKWIIACNRFPKIMDESNGLWRRLMIVDWKVVIKEGSPKMIRDLAKQVIEKELIHVVNWSLAGLVRLMQRNKFIIPQSISDATEREKEISNTVIPFVSDLGINYSQNLTLKEKIYEKYIQYCEEQGFPHYFNVEFWTRMKSRFPELKESKKRSNGGFKRYMNLEFDVKPTIREPHKFPDSLTWINWDIEESVVQSIEDELAAEVDHLLNSKENIEN